MKLVAVQVIIFSITDSPVRLDLVITRSQSTEDLNGLNLSLNKISLTQRIGIARLSCLSQIVAGRSIPYRHSWHMKTYILKKQNRMQLHLSRKYFRHRRSKINLRSAPQSIYSNHSLAKTSYMCNKSKEIASIQIQACIRSPNPKKMTTTSQTVNLRSGRLFRNWRVKISSKI